MASAALGMAPALSLREATIRRLAYRREEAAASLGISPSLFDRWISEGRMPRGHKVGGVVLWDAQAVVDCWRSICEADREGDDDGDNPFDGHVA